MMAFFSVFLICGVPLRLTRAGGVEKPQLKSAFIYQFTNFIDWPKHGTQSQRPFVISIVGDPALEGALRELATQKTVRERKIQVNAVSTVEEAEKSDIVVIASRDTQEFRTFINHLRGKSILTITERDGSAKDSSMINFFMEDGRLRFEINRSRCEGAGFQVNARLLNLARLVGG